MTALDFKLNCYVEERPCKSVREAHAIFDARTMEVRAALANRHNAPPPLPYAGATHVQLPYNIICLYEAEHSESGLPHNIGVWNKFGVHLYGPVMFYAHKDGTMLKITTELETDEVKRSMSAQFGDRLF